MNNDLISREALKKALIEAHINRTLTFDIATFDCVMSAIDNAPTVEVTKPQSYVMGFCDGLKAQIYEKPPMFERTKESELIKAYTKGFDTGVETVKSERPHGEEQMIKINNEELDREDILKAVHLLDIFTKTFCRYRNDYERFDDLKFRCDECPFSSTDGYCQIKIFKNKYFPDYKDFGSMGDL